MSKKKFIRNRRRREKKPPMNLELNSLLDVLVILLVFLIRHYSASDVEVAIQKGLLAPVSESVTEIKRGVTIQVSNDYKVYIENQLITQLTGKKGRWGSEDEFKIKNELANHREKIKQLYMQTSESVPFTGIVNLIMDKRLNYNHVEMIMDLSSDVGFEQFKFIVVES